LEAAEKMKRALKLALVDPKHLEYRDLNKSSDLVAKAGLSMDIRQLLNDSSLPDDLKMKMYRQALDRFLNMGNKLEADSNQFGINYEHQLLPPPVPKKETVVTIESDEEPVAKSRKKHKKQKPPSESPLKTPAAAAATPKAGTPKRGRAVRKSSRQGRKRQLSPNWLKF
jgi:hypothetical protein